MDNVEWLADIIYYYPSEVVTRSGCEGLAKYLLENGVTLFPSVPGCDDKYNIAEMAYNNGYEKGLADGKREHAKFGRWIIHSSGQGANATNWAECSECRVCGSPQWKVCPVCETKMDPVQFPANDFDPDDLMGEYEDENV
jgi:hypothetical protein